MTTLLVPVSLEVLVVRPTDPQQNWSVTALNDADLRPKVKGDKQVQLCPDPFQDLPHARAPGAYLHWAVPDGLTCGEHSDNGTTFPPLPDRWLIVRLSGARPRAVEAWLLPDSGASTATALSNVLSSTPPPLPAGNPPIGKVTAIGQGDLAWAAYYDNVVNRFSFYDPLDGVAGPVAYLVFGWFADVSKDPIAGLSETSFQQQMERLGWHCDEVSEQAGVPPSRSAYHGEALSIGWTTASWPGDGGILGRELDLRPRPSDVDVGLGETLPEALSALTSKLSPRLAEAALAGVLRDIASADGPATLDTALHQSRFGSAHSKEDANSETFWQPTLQNNSATDKGTLETGMRSRPRLWHALDPGIVLKGAGRSPRHGGDGRYADTGTLQCRLSTVTAFGVDGGNPGLGSAVLPTSPLGALPKEYGVPEVAASLLIELASLDPGSAPDLSQASATQTSPVAAARARWWASFDPANSSEDALADSQVKGTLPSPVAVTPPTRPWTPIHLEWAASYLPSPHGIHGWGLGDVDFDVPQVDAPPEPDTDHPLSGRTLLTSAPASMLEQSSAALGSTSGSLATADLLGGTLENIDASLRGDWTGAIVHGKDYNPHKASSGSFGSRPKEFVALRAGFFRLTRLRVVDGFGQYLELLETGGAALFVGESVAVAGQPDLAAFRPRFTAPARVLLRFRDPCGGSSEAGDGLSPVCGYLVASPIDGTLEFFDADGTPRGRLRPDLLSGSAWEDDPGQVTALGTQPSTVMANPYLGHIADQILAADLKAVRFGRDVAFQSALAALVAALNTTRWSVDLTGRSGDEHLSLLLGHPIAVVRASLKIEVDDPHKPPENAQTSIPVKLGTLAHLQDGLLAYFVGDNFDRVHLVDPAIAELAADAGHDSIDSAFIDPSAEFDAYPGSEVPLTLLMTPGSDVHVTVGLLPQKAVGLLREWTAPGLANLAPALRYGPVLHDQTATRLPVSPDIRGIWLWNRRLDPAKWAMPETVVPATNEALLPDEQIAASDGWLQVHLLPEPPSSPVQLRITCIKTRPIAGGKRKILEVGVGDNPVGPPFLSKAKAVALQESGRFQFYVQQPGSNRVDTQVLKTDTGEKYLQTEADNEPGNNLQNLPDFGS